MGFIHRKELSMKKEKLEEFFNNINNAEDLIMYHLFKRGWKFVNVFKSGIMTKGMCSSSLRNMQTQIPMITLCSQRTI